MALTDIVVPTNSPAVLTLARGDAGVVSDILGTANIGLSRGNTGTVSEIEAQASEPVMLTNHELTGRKEILLPWDRQPQETVGIDWGNPITSGLEFLWSGHAPFIDSAANRQATGLGTGSFITSRFGIGLSNPADSAVSFASDSKLNVIRDITTFALVVSTNLSADSTVFAKTIGNGSTNSPYDFGLNQAKIRLVRSAGSFRAWASGTNHAVANTPLAIAASQGSDISVAPTFFANGIRDSAAPTLLYGGTGSGSAVTNTQPLLIANRADLFTDFPGGIYLCAIWSRQLSAEEHASIAANPWQLFESRRIVIPQYGVKPSTIYTLSSPTDIATSRGMTRIHPRVTVTES